MDHQTQKMPPFKSEALVFHQPPQAIQRRGYYQANENPYGFEAPEDKDQGANLIDFWHILVRHKRSIFVASLCGLIMGVAICVPMKPVYRATTSIEVLSLNQDFMNMKGASPTNGTDGSYDTSEESTQAKLLQGVSLTKRVFAKLLPESAVAKSKRRSASNSWRAWLHLPDPVPQSPREVLLDKAAQSLKVRENARTRVLEITVDSTDAQLSADYANTLTREFMAQSAEQRWESTQTTSDWLRRELDEARNKLRHSEDDLQAYARQSGIIFTDDSTNVVTEKLQQVQQELSTASADRISKQSRFELAQNSPPGSLADVLNDPPLRETQSKINDLDRQIADLGAIFNPEYSKLRRLQAERDSLKQAFNSERVAILSRIKTDYEESVRRERLLTAAYDAQTRAVTGQGEKTIQYNILKREVDSNRQLYDTMLQQMKESSISLAMRASNVRVVDPADVPELPVFPNFKIAGALGLFVGMLFSSIFVVIRDQLDRTLHQPGEIKLWADLPELGAIPRASLAANAGLERVYGPLEVESGVKPEPGPRPTALAARPVELITENQKPSLIAESFRSTLTSILFVGGSDENRPRVIMLTSTDAGDGKTTVTSNLALAAAEIRMRVLVIDADLRRPRLHKVFKLSNEFGLADLLQNDLDQESIARAVQTVPTSNLHIIPAGNATSAAAHVLYSPNLPALLNRVRDQYDLIIVDTPPMLHMSDARIVARHTDAVVLVARAGRTSRDALLAVKQRFTEDHVNILGTVLNDWDTRRGDNRYYQYSYGNRRNEYARSAQY